MTRPCPIPAYPEAVPLTLEMRRFLHPLLKKLPCGVSEFSFANLFLFRANHNYRVTRLPDARYAFLGEDPRGPFFMLPFDLPAPDILAGLFAKHGFMKCVPEPLVLKLETLGYAVAEDRDNFDYLYSRHDLAHLPGRKFHKKKNLIRAFEASYTYEGFPLMETDVPDALQVLEDWRAGRDQDDDYAAAKEALLHMEALQLCGGIYRVDGKPAAYTLGEENALGKSFIIHFEKAAPGYKGLYQFLNQCFAKILPEKYETINREQDLGDEGLRKAKLSYQPVGFVKKYRATVPAAPAQPATRSSLLVDGR